MKNYYEVLPDKIRLLQKHFTPGRAGHRVKYITRHHLAMVGDTDAAWNVWQSRAASASYVVSPTGEVGQVVYDRDTPWSNANLTSNRETITIEHSNSAINGYPISDTTILVGARLAASLCLFYKLGRPLFGANIRDHREFTSTSCPHHLALGGKYHDRWMAEAQRFYDLLAAGKVNPDGTLKAPQPRKEPKDVLTIKYFTDFITGFIGPVISDVKDIREQITGAGGRDGGKYPGWSISELVRNYQHKPGDRGTMPEMLAVALTELEKMRTDIDEIKKNGAK
ncbi:peptidoglycan recognition protein family protein [Corynebacterium rhinophilum]|uniref:peptidoglycan recognition protein family protein n=1 Tax=Corynebacterium rhinophilum TaxID=3050197 RepID=UPI0025500319|nr:N-acetylmuramoyl-L-alanine amidase [Corynebacterium sp. MSK192]MDK8697514.1 N-acetylmuramoyl-L-alanine amidase [Corynebacterium sp. MSK192]